MPRRSWLGFILILALNYLAFRLLFPNTESAKVPYTIFKQQAAQGNVSRIASRGDRIAGRFTRSITYPAKPDSTTNEKPRSISQFTTTIPVFADPGDHLRLRHTHYQRNKQHRETCQRSCDSYIEKNAFR